MGLITYTLDSHMLCGFDTHPGLWALSMPSGMWLSLKVFGAVAKDPVVRLVPIILDSAFAVTGAVAKDPAAGL
jgi:hypothetical protein